MKDIFLVNYSVRGIKTLDKLVSLSFYKKIISKNFDTQEYNVKGIYGMNGSGKSAIITSVGILKNVLTTSGYLNNPIVQKNLDEIINKKLGELYIEADFISKFDDMLMYYRYTLTLSKNKIGKYIISYEKLSSKEGNSKTDSLETVFEVVNGEIWHIKDQEDKSLAEMILHKTINLLANTSMCELFCENVASSEEDVLEKYSGPLLVGLMVLFIFSNKLYVYLDQSDDHSDYFFKNLFQCADGIENRGIDRSLRKNYFREIDTMMLNVITVTGNVVLKDRYERFESMVANLYEFVHIFKSDLKGIEIDKKEDHGIYICSLVMVYDSYKIHAEFESTGIKKLIKLYAYLREMVQGGIVFIDEFDSNLHDVYLCALLEYLMEYAEGQLCFTTHNVGPMDILKQHKKSIDFLSVDGTVYPWVTNGNYSPSKLYRNGMIEGSPFNVDSIDFIGAFGVGEEDE